MTHAFKALLDQRTGWTMNVTTHGWQAISDGHSCGIWATWLTHKFMQFTVDGPMESDLPKILLERWASLDIPSPSLLQSNYHELFYE